jgi:hypothetical protein
MGVSMETELPRPEKLLIFTEPPVPLREDRMQPVQNEYTPEEIRPSGVFGIGESHAASIESFMNSFL